MNWEQMSQPAKKSKAEGYQGFKLSKSSKNEIETINLDEPIVTKEWFFQNYIKPRKPVLIKYNANSEKFRLKTENFRPDTLIKTLGDEGDLLQVEELSKGGFGSGHDRLKLSLGDFLERIKNGESLYLTTQYEENDPKIAENNTEEGEEEDDDHDDNDDDEGEGHGFAGFGKIDENASDVDEFGDVDDFEDDYKDEFADELLGDDSNDINIIYQPPLTNLLDDKLESLPPHATEITESLVPQQINLWCGRTPAETPQLEIGLNDAGSVKNVNNGLSQANATSTGLHHDHADNLYILVQGKKRFTLFSPDFAYYLYTTGDVRDIYHTGVIDYVVNEKAKSWINVRADGGCLDSKCEIGGDQKTEQSNGERQAPPSFCRIPPSLLHLNELDEPKRVALEKYALECFPLFVPYKDQSIQVTLEDGDLLYLPAGWFHEVTSYGDKTNDNIHVALNYWFVPPDGESVNSPYTDPIWEEDFRKWKDLYL